MTKDELTALLAPLNVSDRMVQIWNNVGIANDLAERLRKAWTARAEAAKGGKPLANPFRGVPIKKSCSCKGRPK